VLERKLANLRNDYEMVFKVRVRPCCWRWCERWQVRRPEHDGWAQRRGRTWTSHYTSTWRWGAIQQCELRSKVILVSEFSLVLGV
jgi:hypothetical protein